MRLALSDVEITFIAPRGLAPFGNAIAPGDVFLLLAGGRGNKDSCQGEGENVSSIHVQPKICVKNPLRRVVKT